MFGVLFVLSMILDHIVRSTKTIINLEFTRFDKHSLRFRKIFLVIVLFCLMLFTG